ncbi:hypothetical protein [Modestobacter sp. SYSU DS0290]
MRVEVVEGRDDAVVVATGFAETEELDVLHLDLAGVRLGPDQLGDLVDEVGEGHGELALLVSRQRLTRFGGPEVLDVADLPCPAPGKASSCATAPRPA